MTDPLARVAALPGVASAADEARRAVDRLLASRVLRNRSGEVTGEVALRDARASAALDGPVP
ncbi:MAG TPA: oxidoreductase, partial [Mycobacteriales bacterium]|nr:oxidoreductase [Mycobacteriales bacterium]